jgi:hypothetical protein
VVKRKQLLVHEPNETNFHNEKSNKYLTELPPQMATVIKNSERPYKIDPPFKPVQKQNLGFYKTIINKSEVSKSQHIQDFTLSDKFKTKTLDEIPKPYKNLMKEFETKSHNNPKSQDLYSKMCSK